MLLFYGELQVDPCVFSYIPKSHQKVVCVGSSLSPVCDTTHRGKWCTFYFNTALVTALQIKILHSNHIIDLKNMTQYVPQISASINISLFNGIVINFAWVCVQINEQQFT